MADFEGRTALITGGSRGIGAAVARTLAARGADVAINYHSNRDAAESVAKEIRALGRRAGIYQADVTDAAACEAMAETALRELGPISILVNNAGVGSVSEGQPQIAAMADDQLQRLLDAHVFVASILTAVYFILRDGVDYHDLGADYFDRSDKTRATSRLVRRLMDLGYQVELKTGRSARAPLTARSSSRKAISSTRATKARYPSQSASPEPTGSLANRTSRKEWSARSSCSEAFPHAEDAGQMFQRLRMSKVLRPAGSSPAASRRRASP